MVDERETLTGIRVDADRKPSTPHSFFSPPNQKWLHTPVCCLIYKLDWHAFRFLRRAVGLAWNGSK